MCEDDGADGGGSCDGGGGDARANAGGDSAAPELLGVLFQLGLGLHTAVAT